MFDLSAIPAQPTTTPSQPAPVENANRPVETSTPSQTHAEENDSTPGDDGTYTPHTAGGTQDTPQAGSGNTADAGATSEPEATDDTQTVPVADSEDSAPADGAQPATATTNNEAAPGSVENTNPATGTGSAPGNSETAPSGGTASEPGTSGNETRPSPSPAVTTTPAPKPSKGSASPVSPVATPVTAVDAGQDEPDTTTPVKTDFFSASSSNEAVRQRALRSQQDRIIRDMLAFIVENAGEANTSLLTTGSEEETSDRDNLVVRYYQHV